MNLQRPGRSFSPLRPAPTVGRPRNACSSRRRSFRSPWSGVHIPRCRASRLDTSRDARCGTSRLAHNPGLRVDGPRACTGTVAGPFRCERQALALLLFRDLRGAAFSPPRRFTLRLGRYASTMSAIASSCFGVFGLLTHPCNHSRSRSALPAQSVCARCEPRATRSLVINSKHTNPYDVTTTPRNRSSSKRRNQRRTIWSRRGGFATRAGSHCVREASWKDALCMVGNRRDGTSRISARTVTGSGARSGGVCEQWREAARDSAKSAEPR